MTVLRLLGCWVPAMQASKHISLLFGKAEPDTRSRIGARLRPVVADET